VEQHLQRSAKACAKFTGFLRRARGDERGAAAVWFGLTLAFMLPLVLIGINLHMASSEKLKLQDALDAATLAAARSPFIDEIQLTDVGKNALIANLISAGRPTTDTDFQELRFWTEDRQTVQSAVTMTSTALAATKLGFASVGAGSQVMRSGSRLEIALVLDNTGSMQANDKIGTLKEAAEIFVAEVAKAASFSPDAGNLSPAATPLRIALVPFSNTVRVPLVDGAKRSNNWLYMTSYTGANQTDLGVPGWIDPKAVQHWPSTTNNDIFSAKATDRFTMLKTINRPWYGCLEARRESDDVSGTRPTTGTAKTFYVPYFWPDEPDTQTSKGKDLYLNDYIPDKTTSTNWQTRLRNVSKYTGATPETGTITLGSTYGTPYNRGPNAGCELAPMIPLTATSQTILNGIDDMNAMGETNITIGLAWGWNMLQPNYAYFGADANGPTIGQAYETANLKKIVVLMTDGQNTFSDMNENNNSMYGGLGYGWQNIMNNASSTSGRTTKMNARLSALCTNMKAAGITIYTIGVEDVDDSLLTGCASQDPDSTDPNKKLYYKAESVGQMVAVFQSVAGSITDLRVSK
jgi:Flp pilus assembly protein TadG